MVPLAGTSNHHSTPRIETALEWYQRKSKRRRKLGSEQQQQELPWWASFTTTPSTNPTEEALRVLWGGHTGIAPVDAAWKLAVSNMAQQFLEQPYSIDSLPPAVLLEGPKDCGKTWMLLSLAARVVVATRASAFENREENSKPQVLFMDSNLDFSISKLTHIVRSTLLREYSRKQQDMSKEAESTGKENYGNTGTATTTGNPLQTAPIQDLENDVDECLSRIHVIQVDNGMTGWVPVLEALRQELGKQRESSDNPSKNTPPTLLLWDGFLADTAGSETSSREVLQQMSRLLELRKSLWWVLSARTSTGGSSSRIGNQVAEWWMKQQRTQQQSGSGQQTSGGDTIPREFCRVRLDKATMGGNSNPSAFAATVTSVNNSSNNNNIIPKKVPYSLSLQGILS